MTQLDAVDLEQSAAVDTARGETLASATAHTFAASVIGVAVALGISIVVARQLGPSLKGTYDLAIASAGLLALLLGLALPTGITYAVSRGLAAPRRVVKLVLVVGLLQLIAALGIVAFGPSWLGISLPTSGTTGEIQILVASVAAAAAIAAAMKAIVMGRQQVARANWIDLAGRVLMLVLVSAVALVVSQTSSSAEVIVGCALVSTLITVVAFALAAGRGTRPGGPLHLAEGVRVALPSYVANILQFLNYRLDLFLLAVFRSSAEVGIYALAVTLAQLIWILSNSIGAAMFPRVAGGNEDDRVVVERTERFSRFAFMTALGMAVPFALLSLPLLGIVYGADFQSAALPIVLLLPGIVAFAPVNVIASHLAGVGRPGLNLVVSGAALAVTVIFDLALIPVWGMSGAAVATSVSYVVAACITLWVFRRIAGSTIRSLLVMTSADVSLVRERVRSIRAR